MAEQKLMDAAAWGEHLANLVLPDSLLAGVDEAYEALVDARQALAEAEAAYERVTARARRIEQALQGLINAEINAVFDAAELAAPDELDQIPVEVMAGEMAKAYGAAELPADALPAPAHLVVTPDQQADPAPAKPKQGWKQWMANAVRSIGSPPPEETEPWWYDQWEAGLKPSEAVKEWQKQNTEKALANATAEAARLVEPDGSGLVEREDGQKRRPVLANPAVQAAADLPDLGDDWANRPPRHARKAAKAEEAA